MRVPPFKFGVTERNVKALDAASDISLSAMAADSAAIALARIRALKERTQENKNMITKSSPRAIKPAIIPVLVVSSSLRALLDVVKKEKKVVGLESPEERSIVCCIPTHPPMMVISVNLLSVTASIINAYLDTPPAN